MAYRTRIKVRFGDVDPAGIVYYPSLTHYVHLAMEDFFDHHLDAGYAGLVSEHRLGFPTVRLEMSFRKPLRYGDVVAVEATVERIGSSSVEWRYRLDLPSGDATGRPVAEARTVTVCMDLDVLEKRPVPPWLRHCLESAA